MEPSVTRISTPSSLLSSSPSRANIPMGSNSVRMSSAAAPQYMTQRFCIDPPDNGGELAIVCLPRRSSRETLTPFQVFVVCCVISLTYLSAGGLDTSHVTEVGVHGHRSRYLALRWAHLYLGASVT